MNRASLLVASAAAAALSSACATAIPLPRVEDHELRGVEVEVDGSTVAELDRERNLRYWEITLTDEEVLGRLSPEDRSQITSMPIRDLAGELHEQFSAEAGTGVLVFTRLVPSVVREAAARSDSDDSAQLFQIASYADRMQAVVHRRIYDVGRRVAAATSRSSRMPGTGSTRSLRSSSVRTACSSAPSSHSPLARTTSSPARSATSSRT